jgi:Exodeoxyribonuclease X-like C-terminal
MAGRPEFEDVLRELAQQQSALSQQQTALLRLQTESLRLQRLLIERAMGGAPTEEVATVVTTEDAHRVAPEPVESAEAAVSVAPLKDAEANVPPAMQSVETRPADDAPFGESPQGDMPSSKPASGAASLPRSRAARYLQPHPATAVRPVSRQDVDRVTRLYEAGDAAHLVLNFGQYRGATLVQVAQTDPDYVHQLALTAQRPEVRAAARQMVIALEEVAAHKARPARRARSTR